MSKKKLLSRASGLGSPINHPGSRQWQDTGPGILDKAILVITTQKFKKKEERIVHGTRFTKAGWAWHVTLYNSGTMHAAGTT